MKTNSRIGLKDTYIAIGRIDVNKGEALTYINTGRDWNQGFETDPSLGFQLISTPGDTLEKYVGVYSNPAAPRKWTVTRDGGTLFVQPGSESAVALEATAPDKFQLFGGKVTFEFDPAKKQMILKRGGRPMAFTKEK